MNAIAESKVIHAGTMNSGNPSVAASLATIEILEKEDPYQQLFQYGKKLMDGIREAAASTNQKLVVQGPGPMFHTSFTNLASIKDYRDTLHSDQDKLKKFIAGMHERNIRIIGRGLWYISTAHTEDDIERAIRTAGEVLENL